MCKMYDAIYKLADHVESDILICSLTNIKVEGRLHRCDCGFDKDKCYDGVITLEDATVTCYMTNETKKFKWLNISSKQIQMFAYKCCEV